MRRTKYSEPSRLACANLHTEQCGQLFKSEILAAHMTSQHTKCIKADADGNNNNKNNNKETEQSIKKCNSFARLAL